MCIAQSFLGAGSPCLPAGALGAGDAFEAACGIWVHSGTPDVGVGAARLVSSDYLSKFGYCDELNLREVFLCLSQEVLTAICLFRVEVWLEFGRGKALDAQQFTVAICRSASQ